MTKQKGFSIVEWMLILSVGAIIIALLVTFIVQTDPSNQRNKSAQASTSARPVTERTYSEDDLTFKYPAHLTHDKNVQGSRVFKTSDYEKSGEYIAAGYAIGFSPVIYEDYSDEELINMFGPGNCDTGFEECEMLTSKNGVIFIMSDLKNKKSSHFFGEEIQAHAISDSKKLFVFGIRMNKDAKNIEQALDDLRSIIASLSFKPEYTFLKYQ